MARPPYPAAVRPTQQRGSTLARGSSDQSSVTIAPDSRSWALFLEGIEERRPARFGHQRFAPAENHTGGGLLRMRQDARKTQVVGQKRYECSRAKSKISMSLAEIRPTDDQWTVSCPASRRKEPSEPCGSYRPEGALTGKPDLASLR